MKCYSTRLWYFLALIGRLRNYFLARGIISASIFSENVEGMKLKFAEEME